MAKTKTYAKIGEIPMLETSKDDTPPTAGELNQQQVGEAYEVLRRWSEVSIFNIGTAATIELLSKQADNLS